MNEKDQIISIVILNYNGLKFLEKTIPKLIFQKKISFEIIVVDNLSTDDSIKYLELYDNIRVIKNKINEGYSKGKNIGAKNANGEYLLLLDEDMLLESENTLYNLYSNYNKLENVAFMSPLIKDVDKNNSTYYGIYYSIKDWLYKKRYSIEIIKSKKNYLIGGPHGGAIFIKKKIWDEIGHYDESQPYMIDDFDIGARAYNFGYKNYLFTEEVITHLGVNNINRKGIHWKYRYYFSGMARSMVKNFNIINLIIYLPLFFIFCFFKTIKLFFKTFDFKIIFGFLSSIILFLKNIFSTIKLRHKIQKKRINKSDIFLKIKFGD